MRVGPSRLVVLSFISLSRGIPGALRRNRVPGGAAISAGFRSSVPHQSGLSWPPLLVARRRLQILGTTGVKLRNFLDCNRELVRPPGILSMLHPRSLLFPCGVIRWPLYLFIMTVLDLDIASGRDYSAVFLQ